MRHRMGVLRGPLGIDTGQKYDQVRRVGLPRGPWDLQGIDNGTPSLGWGSTMRHRRESLGGLWGSTMRHPGDLLGPQMQDVIREVRRDKRNKTMTREARR
jgi:hypothetical protein